MLKICALLVLLIVGVSAQSPNSEAQAAPEPYNYGYQTDSHAASEQRDPQGRVTGFYMLTDADGRERRVDYVADEGGFRAKVATNEVGTKSESPADVEVVASAPSQGQLVYQSQPQPQAQVQYFRQQAAPVVSSQQAQGQLVYQSIRTQSQPQAQYLLQQVPIVSQQVAQQRSFTVSPVQQVPVRNLAQYQYVLQPQQVQSYTLGSSLGNSAGYAGSIHSTGVNQGRFNVGNYNNHLPSQYYRSINSNSQAGLSSGGIAYGTSYGGSSYAVPIATRRTKTTGSASDSS